MYESFLFDIGSLFFAAWGVIVAVVSVTAFRQELFPASGRSSAPSREESSRSEN